MVAGRQIEDLLGEMREITGGKKGGGVTFKKVVPSNEAHHIIARVDGGSDGWDNLMALCSDCHKVLEGRGRRSQQVSDSFGVRGPVDDLRFFICRPLPTKGHTKFDPVENKTCRNPHHHWL